MERTCSWCGKNAITEAITNPNDGMGLQEHKAACKEHGSDLTQWVKEWNKAHTMTTRVLAEFFKEQW